MSLFQKSEANPAGTAPLIMQFDGGSRGNPGPAGIGVTLTTEKGAPVYELAEFLGTCTNNVAEYTAFLRGLAAALALGAKKVTVRSDSELLVRQINGIYKVKSPDLKPLFEKAQSLIRQIGDVKVNHVYRESNSRADELANMAMDTRKKIEPLGPPGTINAALSPARNTEAPPQEETFPRLHFPANFDATKAREAEARGHLPNCEVELEDGSHHPVSFYAASRIAYELEREPAPAYIAERGMVILRKMTPDAMLKAVKDLSRSGFFID